MRSCRCRVHRSRRPPAWYRCERERARSRSAPSPPRARRSTRDSTPAIAVMSAPVWRWLLRARLALVEPIAEVRRARNRPTHSTRFAGSGVARPRKRNPRRCSVSMYRGRRASSSSACRSSTMQEVSAASVTAVSTQTRRNSSSFVTTSPDRSTSAQSTASDFGVMRISSAAAHQPLRSGAGDNDRTVRRGLPAYVSSIQRGRLVVRTG